MTATQFDPDGRGPSATRLLLTGAVCVVLTVVVVIAMVENSRGTFRDTVAISARMANLGDGLPLKSDVKFQGVRVGSVMGVDAGTSADTNLVRIELTPDYAGSIPSTVTARVVPSNVFAVPSVQLVDNGPAAPVHAGSQIDQDRSLATVRLQTSLDQIRNIVSAVGRGKTDAAVGVLATIAKATDSRGSSIGDAGRQLRDITTTLNQVISGGDSPASMLNSLSDALSAVDEAAPEAIDALHHAVAPLLTVAGQRAQITALLTGGLHTLGTLGTALDNNTERLLGITSHISPVLAVLGDGARTFPQITRSVTNLTGKIADDTFDPVTQRMPAAAIAQFTPTRQYTRAECPRYGELAGASCATGPETAPAPAPGPAVDPSSFDVPDSLTMPNIGPVGSAEEQLQIADILGGLPSAASDILFGPLARGSTVTVLPAPTAPGADR